VWIEIVMKWKTCPTIMVTPFAGVWIEIFPRRHTPTLDRVTPFAGVWIEIMIVYSLLGISSGHALRGRVD